MIHSHLKKKLNINLLKIIQQYNLPLIEKVKIINQNNNKELKFISSISVPTSTYDNMLTIIKMMREIDTNNY
jgi:hypothetical protein